MQLGINAVHDRSLRDVATWWQMADEHRYRFVGIPDSPALQHEAYVTSAACLERTRGISAMAAVTNPVTRDPSVAAAALFTLNELAPGRVAMGIGTGDSALWGVGLKPARMAQLREYVAAVRALLRGEEASYQGRRWRARWPEASPVEIPVYIAAAGPKMLRLAAGIADGIMLAMGVGEENIAYVSSLVAQGCEDVGRDPQELELWWNSEVVWADSVEEARDAGLGATTAWLTMGTLEGKQIPDDLKNPLIRFNEDVHNINASYLQSSRARELVTRAKDLGLYDWLVSRSPGLWGTPSDVAERLADLETQGLGNWMFYVGRGELDREEHVRLLTEELVPELGRCGVTVRQAPDAHQQSSGELSKATHE